MIVTCEGCGKRYEVDEGRIKGRTAKARCKSCGRVITITRTGVKSPATPRSRAKGGEEVPHEPPAGNAEAREKGLGLGLKSFALFFLIPIVFTIGAGGFCLWAVESFSSSMIKEGYRAVTQMGERIIAEKAVSVAEQVRLYLVSRPNMDRRDFGADQEFRDVAVQKVGLTGHTALHALPDEKGVWRTWAHTDPKIIGMDMTSLKSLMGQGFEGFWEIVSNGKDGKVSKGYFAWQEKNGRPKERYMVCAPVKGTPYYVSVATYPDELTESVQQMEDRAREIAEGARNTVLMMMGGALLLMGVAVLLCGKVKSKGRSVP